MAIHGYVRQVDETRAMNTQRHMEHRYSTVVLCEILQRGSPHLPPSPCFLPFSRLPHFPILTLCTACAGMPQAHLDALDGPGLSFSPTLTNPPPSPSLLSLSPVPPHPLPMYNTEDSSSVTVVLESG